jgi:hypothetical protein
LWHYSTRPTFAHDRGDNGEPARYARLWPEAEGDRPRDRRRLAVLWRLLPLLRPHRARFLLALTAL